MIVNKAKFMVREIPNMYININIKSINTTSILIVKTMYIGGNHYRLNYQILVTIIVQFQSTFVYYFSSTYFDKIELFFF